MSHDLRNTALVYVNDSRLVRFACWINFVRPKWAGLLRLRSRPPPRRSPPSRRRPTSCSCSSACAWWRTTSRTPAGSPRTCRFKIYHMSKWNTVKPNNWIRWKIVAVTESAIVVGAPNIILHFEAGLVLGCQNNNRYIQGGPRGFYNGKVFYVLF